jgi:Na+/proline symporter
MAALDFQARCMASKTPRVARLGCLIAGLFTIFIGIPFAYMGAIIRVYYGPDSLYSDFTADSCGIALGLPTCAQWNPDNSAFIKMLVHQAPPILDGWCLIGIIAASMSTADGAILAMGTVMSHNVARQLDTWYPSLITSDNLLNIARFTTLPFTLCSAFIATYSGETGYLLIVAFNIVLATIGTFFFLILIMYKRRDTGLLHLLLTVYVSSFLLLQSARSLDAFTPRTLVPVRPYWPSSAGLLHVLSWSLRYPLMALFSCHMKTQSF